MQVEYQTTSWNTCGPASQLHLLVGEVSWYWSFFMLPKPEYIIRMDVGTLHKPARMSEYSV